MGAEPQPLQRSLIARAVVFTTALLGMALSALVFSADILQRVGDGYREKARVARGEEKETLIADAESVYRRAIRFEPWQPAHAFKAGRAYENRATLLPSLSVEAQTAWRRAAEFYGQAVRRHPGNARFHTALAWASLHAGDLVKASRAIQTALKLTPDYPDVRFAAARWYLLQWEALGFQEREHVLALVSRGARERPELYVEAVWQLVRDPKMVRGILPHDQTVGRLLLQRLTERRLFTNRWAEQKNYPSLRVQIPGNGVQVLAHGQLIGRQAPPPTAITAGPWTGMVAGWLSGGLTAKADVDLPRGEAVLYVPVLGEPAGGIWPTMNLTLGGNGIPLESITAPGWRTHFVLLVTPGGRLPLQAVLANGAVILENGHFIERRVSLGPVRILAPAPVRSP